MFTIITVTVLTLWTRVTQPMIYTTFIIGTGMLWHKKLAIGYNNPCFNAYLAPLVDGRREFQTLTGGGLFTNRIQPIFVPASCQYFEPCVGFLYVLDSCCEL